MNPEYQPQTKINGTQPERPNLIESRFVNHNPDAARVYERLKDKESALSVCLRATVRRLITEKEQ